MTSTNIFTLGYSKWPELLLTSQRGTHEVCWSQAVDPVSGWIYSWKTFYRKRNRAVVTRQSTGWSGNKKHQMFFSQYFRPNRILSAAVLPCSDLQEGTIPIPTSKISGEAVRRTQLPTEVAPDNCLKHLCAGYCIGCGAARVVRQHITVRILFKYL